jgi:hypothetical protein
VVSAMPGLAELRLVIFCAAWNPPGDFATFWATADLNNLTAIEIMTQDGLPSLCRLVKPFFSRLRSLTLGDVPREEGAPNMANLVADLTRIQNLELNLEVFEVIPHQSALTGLTRLGIHGSWFSFQDEPNRPSGLPSFLSTLVRLRVLSLSWSLNDIYVEEFMSCFTMLHDLEILSLDLEPPPLASPLDGNISVLGWNQLWPFFGLRLLEVFHVKPWTVEQEVVDSWQQSWRQMGAGPLKLNWPEPSDYRLES